MLRIAVPNKGQLAEPALSMLREAGYLAHTNLRDLVVSDPDNDVEFFFLRPRDVAVYVGTGTLDLGITGRDMMLDSGANVDEVMQLGFAPAMFRLAAPIGSAHAVEELVGKRVATSYPGLLNMWLEEHGIEATVVRLDGAVENAVALGVADWVADVVATGTTMKRAGLEIVGEPIVRSEALLVRRTGIEINAAVETFIRRLMGVMVARAYVMVDYDIENEHLEAACAITPGIESPTVSPLRESGWVAVRAMVPSADVHGVMDELFELGAKGIIVTDIHACRL
ncbi:MAG: ATP phosphoribosyltransferase [Actinomycetes bacterium]